MSKIEDCLGLIKEPTKVQGLKAAWQSHSFQALIEMVAKCQRLKIAWQRHMFQAVIKAIAQCQMFKALWKMVQRLLGCYPFYPCQPFYCKIFLRER